MRLNVQADSGTTGDAEATFSAGTASFALGADQSANGFAMASGFTLGTGDFLRATSTGAVTFPASPGVTITGPLTCAGGATGCGAGGGGVTSITAGNGLTGGTITTTGTIALQSPISVTNFAGIDCTGA